MTISSSHFSDQPDYRAIFESSPALYVVVDREWRVVAVTDTYLAATMRSRDDLVGRYVFEAFPDNPDDANANGTEVWRRSLERVVQTRETDYLPIQRYDIELPADQGGGYTERYWRPLNAPVFDSGGDVRYLIHGVEDVTSSVVESAEDPQETASD